MDTSQDHPQLKALQLMWNLPKETLNKILWVNTTWEEKEQSIGYASEYIDFMDGVCGTDKPEDAWNDWCISNKIEHEIDSNPYLN